MAREAKGKILDIGFADISNEYLEGDVTGFDIKDVPKPKNYTSKVTGDVKDIKILLRGQKFDTIIAGEFIEHLENPLKFLQNVKTLLTESGKLIISTPNPYYPPEVIFNLCLERKHLHCKNHLFLFPPRWMARILEYTGFRLQKMISGGIPLTEKVVIPAPCFICHQITYVAKKQ